LKHEGDPEKTDCNLEVNIAEQGQHANVKVGAAFSISYKGNVWSFPGCPGCIDQVIIGLEDEPLECVYHGMPGLHPGRSFSDILTSTAPDVVGTYNIYGFVTMQYTPEDAMAKYKEQPERRFAVGTITVKGKAPEEGWYPGWLLERLRRLLKIEIQKRKRVRTVR